MKRVVAMVVLVLLLAPAGRTAADEPLRGVALVIGESKYAGGLPALVNPRDDARAMDQMLGDLGFDVTRVLDGDGRKLAGAIADFVDAAKDADVALVYYSGHGIEAGGVNYLAPTDADLSTPQRAGETLVPLTGLLDALAQSVPVSIVLLDACRTIAFAPGTMIQPPGAPGPIPAADNGLAEVRGPTPVALRSAAPDTGLGMVIGFAASPGQPALDGPPGEHSPYAAALLKHLSAGGYSFGDVMTLVGEEVYLDTRARQLPWVNSSLRRVLSFGTPIETADPDETALRDGRRQLLLTIATQPAATRSAVEGIAEAQDVPLAALYGMLKVLGVDTSAGVGDLERQLEEGARQLKQFKEQDLGSASSDGELARLSDLASRAQDEGAIDLALKYREAATARARSLSSERDTLEQGLKADRIEFARTYAEHAQTAALNFDYRTAAAMFGEAYLQVARWDDDLALRYKWFEGNALRDFGDFKNDTNALEQAITVFREATMLASKDKDPLNWALLQNDLGWALETLGERRGDTAALTEAASVLEASIAAFPPETPAAQMVINRMNFGNALSVLGQREADSGRMWQAVKVYEQALADVSRDADPFDWAKLQLDLGTTLANIGEREAGNASLERAVEALDAARSALPRSLSPLDWAQVQNNYATVLFSLADRTHDLAMFEASANAVKLALEEQTEERVPFDWAMAQGNLGNIYTRIAEATRDPDMARQAIDAYTTSLRQLDPKTVPLSYATVQSNLGVIYASLSKMTDDRAMLEKSVESFQEALHYRTETLDPQDWAQTQFSMSAALLELGKSDATPARAQKALEAARAALRQWTREGQPFLWAKGQYALGNALAGIGDKLTGTDEYDQALAAYAAALEVFDQNKARIEWLATKEHYAYTAQSLGERTETPEPMQVAIDAYRDVLGVVTLDTDRFEYARMQFNLGLALQNQQAFGGPNRIDEAIAAYQAASDGYGRDTAPELWADAEVRLAFALHAAASEDGVDQDFAIAKIREAIAHYEAAETVRTRAADAAGWAGIEAGLADAYGFLGFVLGDKATLEQGREHALAARDAGGANEESEARVAQFDQALANMP